MYVITLDHISQTMRSNVTIQPSYLLLSAPPQPTPTPQKTLLLPVGDPHMTAVQPKVKRDSTATSALFASYAVLFPSQISGLVEQNVIS